MSDNPHKNVLHVNVYEVLRRAIEEGVAYGYRRAHKHTDHPDEQTIRQAIEDAVLNAIAEVFTFDEE